MRNKFLLIGITALSGLNLFAQNQATIIAPKFFNSDNNPPVITNLPIPTTADGNFDTPLNTPNNPFLYMSDGYDGQRATGGQNIILDNQGNIMFFVVDAGVYDRKGKSLGVLRDDVTAFGSAGNNNVEGVISEIAIVPVPNECNAYYLVSTINSSGDVTASFAYFGKLVINYDLNNNPLPGSGLEFYNFLPNNTAKPIQPLIGNIYYGINNTHEERPVYAISNEKNNFRYLFINVGTRFFRMKIAQNTITYDNYFLDLNSLGSDFVLTDALNTRQEMEMVELTNGNYRLAIPVEAPNFGLLQTPFTGAFVIDLDPNGTYINGSLKQVKYFDMTALNGGIDSKVRVCGLEFSPNGDRLYATHNKIAGYQSSLDYFVLNQAVPTQNIISIAGGVVDDLQQSQIETIPTTSGTCLIIPANNRMVLISNPNTAVFPSDYNNSYLSLVGYTANAPYPNPTVGQAIRLLQDNVDGMDYGFIENVYFDYDYYNASSTTDLLWEPNLGGTQNNPLLAANNANTHIYIKNELRIPAGKTITIKDMIFHFAPGAKVVVERSASSTSGTGGRLILQNSTFTIDDRCKEDMWLGVEVYGYPSKNQSLSSTVQGQISLTLQSKIEHAYVGIMASKRVTDLLGTSAYDNNYNGAIIRATNSTFFQNRIGVSIPNYIAPSNQTNLSVFTTNTFEWNGPLKKQGVLYYTQAYLNGTKGVNFFGNVFKNSSANIPQNTGFINNGYGIYVNNSSFNVQAYCSSIQCPAPVKNSFTKFNYGVYVVNNNLNAFVVDRSLFDDNWTGIYVSKATYEQITRNLFKVKEELSLTSGLRLNFSTHYRVEENTFQNSDNPNYSLAQVANYGIIVHHSGTDQNKIYKNLFKNIMIGGQSQSTNAITITDTDNHTGPDPDHPGALSMRGLVWKCNTFQTIRDYDLTVIGGLIDYHQGTISTSDPIGNATNNIFSMTGESPALQHDFRIYNAQDINYVHLANANQFPDSRTSSTAQSNNTGVVVPQQAINNQSQPVYTNNSACPSNFVTVGTPGLKQIEIGGEITTLSKKLQDGSETPLLDNVNNNPNLSLVLNDLIEKSPYLSDNVIEAFINRNPTTGQLKQILVLNSPLSQHIKDRILTINMPIGTRNLIDSKQIGESPRTQLENEINQLKKDKEYYDNILISDNLLDVVDVNNTYAISAIESKNDIGSKRELFEYYLNTKDVANQTTFRSQLTNLDTDTDVSTLTQIEMEIALHPSTKDAFASNPNLKSQLILMKNGANRQDVIRKAQNYLNEDADTIVVDTVYVFPDDKSFINGNNDSQNKPFVSNSFTQSYMTIYPNPTSGKVNLDFTNIPDGTMEVQIVDLSGKMVHQSVYVNTNAEIVDLSQINKGLYLVKVLIDKQIVEVQKLELK